MRVLGIDPGVQITGYGCLEWAEGAVEPALIEAGVLRFKSTDPLESRLAEMHAAIVDLIEELSPDRMAVEKLYAHYKHPRTAIVMGHARGVILLAASQADLPIENLPANEVKKAVSGYGHASKQQMQQAVAVQCRLKQLPQPPDVADAIAVALTAGRRWVYDRLSSSGR